ncbi:MAG: alpha/beta hydrolase [Opitutus sp.]
MRAAGRLTFWISLASIPLCARAAPAVVPYGHHPLAGYYAVVNGIRLHYERYGEGAPLIVLHGNGGSIEQLHFQIDHFAGSRAVIGIDSRGQGKSEMGGGRLTYDGMAEDVAALIKQLHLGRVDLLGWSDGGIVALLVALHHPDLVRAVAISGANLSPAGLKPEDLAGMKTELQEAKRKRDAGDASNDWATKCQLLDLMITQPQVSAAELARITAPVLVLAGEHDMIPEEHTRLIATGLPHAQLKIFAGAGHAALQEVPDRFNAVVESFFRDPLAPLANE